MLPSFHNSKRRIGFTLIELLMVISIIAILSGLALAALRGAQEDARAASTTARMTRITSILELQFEEYEFRKLPLPLRSYVTANPKSGPSGPVPTQVQARNLKRRIILELIKSEMPQPIWFYNAGINQFESAFNNQLGGFPTSDSTIPTDPHVSFEQWLTDNYPFSSPVTGNTLLQDLQLLRSSKSNLWLQVAASTSPNGRQADSFLDLSAEYLYFILRFTNYEDSNGLEGLSPSAVGDSDGDGFLEIVDAWGDPLTFQIRQLGPNLVLSHQRLETDPENAEDVYIAPNEGNDIFLTDGPTGLLNSIVPSPFEDIFLSISSENL